MSALFILNAMSTLLVFKSICKSIYFSIDDDNDDDEIYVSIIFNKNTFIKTNNVHTH